jgi:thiamine-phosphate pyrophosphorylase
VKPYRSIDPFYPIVPDAAWAARLVAAGARFIQLRCKTMPRDRVRQQIEEALRTCRAAQAELVVNDYWDLAIDAGASYVHLGQTDIDTADLSALRQRDIRLGVSTHSHEELERALATDPDYVALGPIYPTTLKQMPWEPQGLDRIGEWKQMIGSRPLVAIGGITLERAPLCLKAGADSVAVVSDILQNPHPESRAGAWLQATQIVAS